MSGERPSDMAIAVAGDDGADDARGTVITAKTRSAGRPGPAPSSPSHPVPRPVRSGCAPLPPVVPALSTPVGEGVEPAVMSTRARMNRAQCLRRVFDVDVSRCSRCGTALRVVAAITEPRVIAAILAQTYIGERRQQPMREVVNPAASRDTGHPRRMIP